MTGYIVYNGFRYPAEPPDPAVRLIRAGKNKGVDIRPLPNTAAVAAFLPAGGALPRETIRILTDPSAGFLGNRPDFVLFWDKDVRLARAMEAAGWRLFNRAEAVALCDDKAATHLRLAAVGIPMPATVTAPMTYFHIDPGPAAVFLREAARLLGFPMVVKECFGSLGGQVYLARDPTELARLADAMAARPFLCQQYIPGGNTDKRLYVVGDRVAAAMTRHNRADFRANIAGGGVSAAYSPTAEEQALAVESCRVLGLDFGGVDMLDDGGRPLVCEVNASAYLAEIERVTGVDVASEIIQCLMHNA
ncbi:MAG: RimK family alpha-L-glutamate ligase [Oscillospiraceae bacterium]|nr:RimK family alpha-L-glutamate ligase [Oscillospiraceae bacterium]